MNLTIRSLDETPFTSIYDCFLDAFSSYAVPVQISSDLLRLRWHGGRVDYVLSAGAFDGDTLVGLLMTALGKQRGQLTAYNACIGIRTAYQGKGIVGQMYDFLWPRYQQANIKRCSLEVLTSNAHGIRAYQKAGFRLGRELHCFNRLAGSWPRVTTAPLTLEACAPPSASELEAWTNFGLAWEQHPDTLEALGEHLQGWSAWKGDMRVGYLAFFPGIMRVLHLSVAPTFRRRGVARALARFLPKEKISLTNVDSRDRATLATMEALGFEATDSQYEMSRMI